MSNSNGIFISYRRDGGDGLAGRVRDALTKRGYRAFLDVEDLKTGKFNEALFAEIDRCSDFVVIMSVGALDRCVNEGDWVRLEIAHALRQKKNIVPVLGRNFHFPKTLPADIDDLRHYNGIGASHELFDASIDKLAGVLSSKRQSSQSRRLIGAALILTLLLGGAGILFFKYPEPALPEKENTLAIAREINSSEGKQEDTVIPQSAVRRDKNGDSSPTESLVPITLEARDFIPQLTQFFSSGASMNIHIRPSSRVPRDDEPLEVFYSFDGENFMLSRTGMFLMLGDETLNYDQIQIKINFFSGASVGPFNYPIDFRSFALSQMKADVIKPLSKAPWITTSHDGYILDQFFLYNLPAVTRIEYSHSETMQPTSHIETPSVPLQEFFPSMRKTKGKQQKLEMPIASGPLFFRVVFYDGTTGPVTRLDPPQSEN